ncbi:MAG TPA: DUF2073 domain-containing protein [Candidatus Thermoplasmatota archaeon]|jgi:hypothetical protein|nr:DUF2073 domain-containing protein [Candidatus Thermoplasmatota archaeon]
MSENVAISLVSKKKLSSMSSKEKVSYILEEVKQDKILVLEQGLDPQEEANLIERTMVEIDPDQFIGIEMESYKDDAPRDLFGRFMPKRAQAGRASMTVVGPADRLKTIRKDGTSIQAMILGGDRPKRRR